MTRIQISMDTIDKLGRCERERLEKTCHRIKQKLVSLVSSGTLVPVVPGCCCLLWSHPAFFEVSC